MLLGGDRRVRDGDWELRDDGSFGGVASGYEANGSSLPLPEPFVGELSEGRMSIRFTFFQNLSFDLAPAPGASSGADLSRLARQWTRIEDGGDYVLVLPISADGRLSGAGDSRGCLWEGVFGVPDSSVNVYSVELRLEDGEPGGCGRLQGDGYRGLAAMEGDRLTLMATNGESALAVTLGLDPPPVDDEEERGEGDNEDDEDEEEEEDDRRGRRR